MTSLGENRSTSWPTSTRSDKERGDYLLQLSGEQTEKNSADLVLQHAAPFVDSLISVDEFQTQVDTLEGGTHQVLDDHANASSNELVNADGDTQVVEDSEASFHTKWGSLEGERRVSNEHKDNADTELVDMEGGTQILDGPEYVFQNQLLCTEGPETLSYGRTTVSSSNGSSSKEMDQCKLSSDGSSLISGASLVHTAEKDDASGYVPPRFTEIRIESLRASAAAARSRLEKKNCELNCSINTIQSSEQHGDKITKKSGYVPLRFTEIRVESLIASGLTAKNRALKGKTAKSFCSIHTSPSQQKHVEKKNEALVRVSPSSMEVTYDDYDVLHEPKDSEVGKGRKVKSSAVRKLFAEEVVSHTEASGILLSDDTESELPAGGDNDAAGLGYIYSQEPNELAHAKALDFVERFLKANPADFDKDDHGGFHVKNTNSISRGKCMQTLVKKKILRSSVGVAKAFDWDDNNEDEGGGAFFCKMKEKFFNKERRLGNSAPPIQKSNPFDLEQLDNMEQSKVNDKKRKFSYSDTRLASQNLKKIVKTFETNTKQNISNGWNWQPCAGIIASHHNTPDSPVAGKDAGSDTSTAMESDGTHDINQVISIEKVSSEGIFNGRTRRGSFFKEQNLRKRARPGADMVSAKSVQSMLIPDGREKGTGNDAPIRIEDTKFIMPIEQPLEVPSGARRKTRSGNGQTPTMATSKADSYRMDENQTGQVEHIKTKQSKPKASGRGVRDQGNIRCSDKDARPCRSCRNIKNQGKQSEIMSCTVVAHKPRRASLRNSLNSAKIVQDNNVKPIEQSAETYRVKRSRTTGPIGHDPSQVNCKDGSFKVIKGQICEVQLVEHIVLEQSKPASSDRIAGDPMSISSCRRGIKPRRSHRLNGSSTLDNISLQYVNKHTSLDATGEQQSHTDFGTSVEDTVPKLETSPRGRTNIPCLEFVTPTGSIKSSEEASPICMGNEYYKISCKPNHSRSNLKKEINNLVTCPTNRTAVQKGSRKKRDMNNVRVLFSQHLNEDTLKQQKKILNQLGAAIAFSISDATHFIANEFVRTRNMLGAIALGKPVVTPLWLVHCSKTRFRIDEKNYILRDESKEKDFGFSMPVSLDLARQQPLLQNRRVFVTPNTKPGKEVLACLVKAVCGQVIGRIAFRSNSVLDGLLILTCEEDFEICEPFLEKGATVYSSELLLNGIVTQRLEYERYRLFDDRIKRTRATLWLKKDGKQFFPVNKRRK